MNDDAAGGALASSSPATTAAVDASSTVSAEDDDDNRYAKEVTEQWLRDLDIDEIYRGAHERPPSIPTVQQIRQLVKKPPKPIPEDAISDADVSHLMDVKNFATRAARPASRMEALLLRESLDKFLAEFDLRRQRYRHDPAAEAQLLVDEHNFMGVLAREAIGQVTVVCTERGQLLLDIWVRGERVREVAFDRVRVLREALAQAEADAERVRGALATAEVRAAALSNALGELRADHDRTVDQLQEERRQVQIERSTLDDVRARHNVETASCMARIVSAQHERQAAVEECQAIRARLDEEHGQLVALIGMELSEQLRSATPTATLIIGGYPTTTTEGDVTASLAVLDVARRTRLIQTGRREGAVVFVEFVSVCAAQTGRTILSGAGDGTRVAFANAFPNETLVVRGLEDPTRNGARIRRHFEQFGIVDKVVRGNGASVVQMRTPEMAAIALMRCNRVRRPDGEVMRVAFVDDGSRRGSMAASSSSSTATLPADIVFTPATTSQDRQDVEWDPPDGNVGAPEARTPLRLQESHNKASAGDDVDNEDDDIVLAPERPMPSREADNDACAANRNEAQMLETAGTTSPGRHSRVRSAGQALKQRRSPSRETGLQRPSTISPTPAHATEPSDVLSLSMSPEAETALGPSTPEPATAPPRTSTRAGSATAPRDTPGAARVADDDRSATMSADARCAQLESENAAIKKSAELAREMYEKYIEDARASIQALQEELLVQRHGGKSAGRRRGRQPSVSISAPATTSFTTGTSAAGAPATTVAAPAPATTPAAVTSTTTASAAAAAASAATDVSEECNAASGVQSQSVDGEGDAELATKMTSTAKGRARRVGKRRTKSQASSNETGATHTASAVVPDHDDDPADDSDDPVLPIGAVMLGEKPSGDQSGDQRPAPGSRAVPRRKAGPRANRHSLSTGTLPAARAAGARHGVTDHVWIEEMHEEEKERADQRRRVVQDEGAMSGGWHAEPNHISEAFPGTVAVPRPQRTVSVPQPRHTLARPKAVVPPASSTPAATTPEQPATLSLPLDKARSLSVPTLPPMLPAEDRDLIHQRSVLKRIAHVYRSKTEADLQRSRCGLALLPLADYIFNEYAPVNFGIPSLVASHCEDLFSSTAALAPTLTEVNTFKRFCDNAYGEDTTPLLSLYIRARRTLEQHWPEAPAALHSVSEGLAISESEFASALADFFPSVSRCRLRVFEQELNALAVPVNLSVDEGVAASVVPFIGLHAFLEFAIGKEAMLASRFRHLAARLFTVVTPDCRRAEVAHAIQAVFWRATSAQVEAALDQAMSEPRSLSAFTSGLEPLLATCKDPTLPVLLYVPSVQHGAAVDTHAQCLGLLRAVTDQWHRFRTRPFGLDHAIQKFHRGRFRSVPPLRMMVAAVEDQRDRCNALLRSGIAAEALLAFKRIASDVHGIMDVLDCVMGQHRGPYNADYEGRSLTVLQATMIDRFKNAKWDAADDRPHRTATSGSAAITPQPGAARVVPADIVHDVRNVQHEIGGLLRRSMSQTAVRSAANADALKGGPWPCPHGTCQPSKASLRQGHYNSTGAPSHSMALYNLKRNHDDSAAEVDEQQQQQRLPPLKLAQQSESAKPDEKAFVANLAGSFRLLPRRATRPVGDVRVLVKSASTL